MKKNPIVIDIGTCTTKVGFAGFHIPKSNFPTIIGFPTLSLQKVGGKNKDFFVGFEAESKSDILELKNPMENNDITKLDDIEKLWYHIFHNELNIFPDQHPIILAEKYNITSKERENSLQILFETYNIPGFYSNSQPVFSLLSTGNTTGLILDSGESKTSIVPVFEGYQISHSCLESSISGKYFTNKYINLKKNKGIDISNFKISELRLEKEKNLEIKLKNEDNSLITEVLFNPQIDNINELSIQSLIDESISKLKKNYRNEMRKNIILCGGNSMIKGFSLRLEEELEIISKERIKIEKNHFEEKIKNFENKIDEETNQFDFNYKIISLPERKFSSWIGGSILGSMDSFESMMINKNNYLENGSKIVHFYCYS